MPKNGVKLLGMWASPFSIKVQMALNLKSVEYEYCEEDLLSKSERLLEANPVHKKVPVLIHDEKPICESLFIVEYIDDVWATNGPSIFPSDPYDRAMARFWGAYAEKLHPSMTAVLHADGVEAKKSAFQKEANHCNQVLALLENAFINCSKRQNFFGGDKIGYLDIAVGCNLGWIRALEKFGNASLINESKTPNLFKWAQHFSAVDAVKNVLPETDKLVEFALVFSAKVSQQKIS